LGGRLSVRFSSFTVGCGDGDGDGDGAAGLHGVLRAL